MYSRDDSSPYGFEYDKKGRKLTPQELHDKKFGIDRQLVNLLGRTSNKKCKCKTN
jgi:hypothetical protein